MSWGRINNRDRKGENTELCYNLEVGRIKLVWCPHFDVSRYCNPTYITTHSPTLLLLHLRHSSFSNPSFASPMSQVLHLIHLASRPWVRRWKGPEGLANDALLILHPFHHVASPTLQALHLHHLTRCPWPLPSITVYTVMGSDLFLLIMCCLHSTLVMKVLRKLIWRKMAKSGFHKWITREIPKVRSPIF